MDQRDYNTYCLHQLLYLKERESGHSVYLRQPQSGQFVETTWLQALTSARKIAAFLKTRGLNPGDRVSIISKNCDEWFIADFGIALAGMVSVPIFANQHYDSVSYIFKHADIKLAFIGKLDDAPAIAAGIPPGVTTVSFTYPLDIAVDLHWNDIMANATPDLSCPLPRPDDLFTIMYTSGTSGTPKGVMITHGILANTLKSLDHLFDNLKFPEKVYTISYLPLAHIYERIYIQYASILTKRETSVSFVESKESFGHDLQQISPTLFQAVPLIWFVMQNKILARIPDQKLTLLLKIPLVSWFIKRKLRRVLGLSRCPLPACGAAPLPKATADFFEKLGITIYQGYGQTENLAYICGNNPSSNKFGSVGKAYGDVEVKIDSENQELLVKTPSMMLGYYQDPEATARCILPDGFMRTGDMASIDEEGYIWIIGRVSDQFKTQKGEFINPNPIEMRFLANADLQFACLVGRELPQPILIVELSPEAHQKQREEITNNLITYFNKINPTLNTVEKISHILIVQAPWTTENGLVTPTTKIRRSPIEKAYSHLFEKINQQPHHIVWEQDIV
jgi:long-chain acyl-CoA synthetase